MEYAKLGASDLAVSRLCLGCMSLGQPSEDFHLWTLDEAQSEAIAKYDATQAQDGEIARRVSELAQRRG